MANQSGKSTLATSGARTPAQVADLLFNFTAEAEQAKSSSRERLIQSEEKLQAGMKSAPPFSSLLLLNSEMISDAKSTKALLARINALITKFDPNWPAQEKLIRNSERLRLQFERAQSGSKAAAAKQMLGADAELSAFQTRHPAPHLEERIADYLERLKDISRDLRTYLFGGTVLQKTANSKHPRRPVDVQGWEADLSHTEARIQRQMAQQQNRGHSQND